MRYRLEAETSPFDGTPAGAVGRSGQRTIEGAVVLTLLPVAIVGAASYPTGVLVFLAGAIGTFLATRYRSRATSPATPTQRSRSVQTDQNRSAAASE